MRLLFGPLLALLAVSCLADNSDAQVASFGGTPVVPRFRDSITDYRLDPAREKFYIRVPRGYSSSTAQQFGVIVFLTPEDNPTVIPDTWGGVLDQKRLFFVLPQGGGNAQQGPRRMGLAVLAALKMVHSYKLDPARVYVGGHSGGARIASMLGFHQPDVFRGTIQLCGSDYYRPVAKIHRTPEEAADTQYGIMLGIEAPSAQQVQYAKKYVKFSMITGSGDFRRDFILDIAEGGFSKDGFQSKLIDVPELQHAGNFSLMKLDGRKLEEAIDFVAR